MNKQHEQYFSFKIHQYWKEHYFVRPLVRLIRLVFKMKTDGKQEELN